MSPSVARPKARKSHGRKLAENFVSGAVGGAAGVIVAHPLDTIKVNMQAGWGKVSAGGGRGMGPLGTAKRLLRDRGARGFYSGVGGAVGGTAPAVAARMATYELTKGALEGALGKGPGAQAASAVLGELAGAAFRNPFELVKQRLQAGVVGGGALSAIRAVVREQGVRGLYVGMDAALARDIPQTVINFLVFGMVTDSLRERRRARARAAGDATGGKGRLAEWQNLAAGAAAGGTSAFLTCPIDVVKTKMMTEGAVAGGRSSISLTVKRVIQEEGYRGFFRGAIPRTALIMPDIAVLWMVYEICRNMFGHDGEGGEGN